VIFEHVYNEIPISLSFIIVFLTHALNFFTTPLDTSNVILFDNFSLLSERENPRLIVSITSSSELNGVHASDYIGQEDYRLSRIITK
jgi:hypothetical protein